MERMASWLVWGGGRKGGFSSFFSLFVFVYINNIIVIIYFRNCRNYSFMRRKIKSFLIYDRFAFSPGGRKAIQQIFSSRELWLSRAEPFNWFELTAQV